jgi:hypothetical protein
MPNVIIFDGENTGLYTVSGYDGLNRFLTISSSFKTTTAPINAERFCLLEEGITYIS